MKSDLVKTAIQAELDKEDDVPEAILLAGKWLKFLKRYESGRAPKDARAAMKHVYHRYQRQKRVIRRIRAWLGQDVVAYRDYKRNLWIAFFPYYRDGNIYEVGTSRQILFSKRAGENVANADTKKFCYKRVVTFLYQQ